MTACIIILTHSEPAGAGVTAVWLSEGPRIETDNIYSMLRARGGREHLN